MCVKTLTAMGTVTKGILKFVDFIVQLEAASFSKTVLISIRKRIYDVEITGLQQDLREAMKKIECLERQIKALEDREENLLLSKSSTFLVNPKVAKSSITEEIA